MNLLDTKALESPVVRNAKRLPEGMGTGMEIGGAEKKRKHERWSLWLPMTDNKNTRALWVSCFVCSHQFLPRWTQWQWWRNRAQGSREQKQSTTCPGNPGPWHSQSISGFYPCGFLSLSTGYTVTSKWSNEWPHYFLWRQNKSPEPHMSLNPSGMKTWYNNHHYLTLTCDVEVIGSLYDPMTFAQTLLSLLSLSSNLLHSLLHHSQAIPPAANCIRQPANKSSYALLPHRCHVRAQRRLIEILQDKFNGHQLKVFRLISATGDIQVAGTKLLISHLQAWPVFLPCVPARQHSKDYFKTGIATFPSLAPSPGSPAETATCFSDHLSLQ